MTFATVVPLLPALGKAVTPDNVEISAGLQNLYTFNWLYCFIVAFLLYFALNQLFPHKETLIPEMVPGTRDEDPDPDTGADVEKQMDAESHSEHCGQADRSG